MAETPPVRPARAQNADTGPAPAVRRVYWQPCKPAKVAAVASGWLTRPDKPVEKALKAAGIEIDPSAETVLVTEGLMKGDISARHWAVLETVRGLRGAGRTVRLLERSAGALDGVSGLQGLSRTLRQEWPDMDVACWSLEGALSKLDLAGALSAGLGDVLLTRDGVLEQLVLPHSPELLADGPCETGVWLVSGGARGVTSDCVLALAERLGGGTFLLAGRSAITPWPQGVPETDDLKTLRPALIEQARARGEKPKPKEVDRLARACLAGREIRATLSGLAALGADAHYLQLDLGDAGAVKAELAEAQAAHGTITGLIHGAGVLSDGLAETKTRDALEQVFAPKVRGLLNLMAALAPETLRHIGLFSSAAAIFGNMGQSDYAMANAWLNWVARQLAGDLPGARVKSFCWGPWHGGMVDDTLAAHFRTRGIALIERADGAAVFADHLLYGDQADVELLIGDEW